MGFACRAFLPVAALAALVAAPVASASQLIVDNATNVKLAVNNKGEALVTYKARPTIRTPGVVDPKPGMGLPQ